VGTRAKLDSTAQFEQNFEILQIKTAQMRKIGIKISPKGNGGTRGQYLIILLHSF
jgi:hypothetical protein